MPLLVAVRERLHLQGRVRSREVLVTRDGSVQEEAYYHPHGMFLSRSQGGDYEEHGLLDPRLPFDPEDGDDVPSKRRVFSELHGVTAQKTANFFVPAYFQKTMITLTCLPQTILILTDSLLYQYTSQCFMTGRKVSNMGMGLYLQIAI
jgi:hypothetical protein